MLRHQIVLFTIIFFSVWMLGYVYIILEHTTITITNTQQSQSQTHNNHNHKHTTITITNTQVIGSKEIMRSRTFGKHNSIHLVHDACVDNEGIHYVPTKSNSNLAKQNISSLMVQYEGWSSFRSINVYQLNEEEFNYNYKPENDGDMIGYLLWMSNADNMYHWMFSLIGGYKAIKMINDEMGANYINIDDVQLLYWGWHGALNTFNQKQTFNNLKKMYNNTLTTNLKINEE
eukprot:13528_1